MNQENNNRLESNPLENNETKHVVEEHTHDAEERREASFDNEPNEEKKHKTKQKVTGTYRLMSSKQTKASRKPAIVQTLIGAVLGGMLVVTIQPLLQNTEGENKLVSSSRLSTPIEVSTNGVSTVVQSVEDAVVGVVKYQNGFQGVQEAGTGSGVIYKKEGNTAYIVTNNHVIEGASKIEVSLSDGTRVTAEALGADIYTDLAVLKVDAKYITKVATLGNSDELVKGDAVLAIGNPLGLEFSGSVTQGIVSGLERSVPVDLNGDRSADWEVDVLQTDAAINPGNSGGALVNMKGEVIGINSMKIAQQEVEGIGLSIPIDTAKPIIEQLESTGKVQRPYLGVQIVSLPQELAEQWRMSFKLPNDVEGGILIKGVEPSSPAEAAGLQVNDVIVSIDDKKVVNDTELRKALYKKNLNEKMDITYYRDGAKKTVKVTLKAPSM